MSFLKSAVIQGDFWERTRLVRIGTQQLPGNFNSTRTKAHSGLFKNLGNPSCGWKYQCERRSV